MPQSFAQKMQELKRVIRLHASWLVYATLGESALSSSEVTELKKYGKLPMGQPLDLVDKSYLLGRFRALYKRREYSNVNYEQVPADLNLSPLEELVVEQARLRAGQSMRGVSQEIADGVYSSLSQVLGKAVSEAVVSQTVADETALAIIYKKTAQELASNLAVRLQTGQRRNWKIVAETAMHAAKVAGSAQAIVNKVGVYTYSDGPESLVSVVPGQMCCADCTSHYTGSDGQPRVFRLSTLLGSGSNADGDVTHTKQNGQHTNWKTTLPPLHPSCGCSLVYVPPGHSWVNGKLTMLNKSLFTEHLAKARNGVSGGISPTVEPKGAPSNQSEGAGVASLPGAAAPGNHAGPGRPSGGLPKPGSGTLGGAGGGSKTEPCPLMHCPDGGRHHPDSAVMKEHTAQAQRTGDFTPAAKEANEKQLDIEGQKYDVAPHPREVALTHLRENKIGAAKPLSKEDGEAGVHSTFKVSLVGNGNAAMKPPPKFSDNVLRGNSLADGASTTPANSGHKAEAAAFSIASSLGLQDHVPPTITRSHDGSHDMEAGEYSLQQWKDGHMPVTFGTADETMRAESTPAGAPSSGTSLAKNNYGALIQAANLGGGEAAAEKMHNKLSEIAVLDAVMNNNDRHFGNIVMNPNRQDITAIDHGLSFGSGMQGHKNGIHRSMDQAGRPLIVPDHLHEQFKNRSLGDTERALDGHGLQPWQVMQTHLRQKYVAHLQDTHGYVPHEATRGVMTTCGGSESFALGHGWGKSKEADSTYEAAFADHQTPDQLFASFSKDHISKGLADKDNPAHADFVKMAEEMPAHQPGFAYKRSYQGSAQHQKYWDSIPAYQGVKCESFSTRFKVKQPEAASPVRTPPSIPTTRQGTVADQLSPDSPEPAKIQKSAKIRNGLWINLSGAFPLTGSDLE